MSYSQLHKEFLRYRSQYCTACLPRRSFYEALFLAPKRVTGLFYKYNTYITNIRKMIMKEILWEILSYKYELEGMVKANKAKAGHIL